MTLEQIRISGLEALARELGPVGMVRFLQQFDEGRGDYTSERAHALPQMDVNSLIEQIYETRRKQSDGTGNAASQS